MGQQPQPCNRNVALLAPWAHREQLRARAAKYYVCKCSASSLQVQCTQPPRPHLAGAHPRSSACCGHALRAQQFFRAHPRCSLLRLAQLVWSEARCHRLRLPHLLRRHVRRRPLHLSQLQRTGQGRQERIWAAGAGAALWQLFPIPDGLLHVNSKAQSALACSGDILAIISCGR